MARIAIVETYPYEAVWGGEAAYLDRLRAFLVSRGHRVTSLVSDVSRGRSSPLLRLRSAAGDGHCWIVRGAVPIGSGRLIAPSAGLLLRAGRRALGRTPGPERPIGDGELVWIRDRLAALYPDVVLLAFDASRFAAALAAPGRSVVAMPGFFGDRVLRLGDIGASARSRAGTRWEGLVAATMTCLNNVSDLDHYRASTGAVNGALVGMGFPRHEPPAPGIEPILLFVGARTKPNVAALRWFVDRCWPAVRGGAPGARLRIVGSAGDAFAASPAGIEPAGFVDDVAAEYARARFVIAPLLVGTHGVKSKIAEALAHGRPVVTTSIGVDPADRGRFGGAVEVADDPAGFAAAVVRLLGDAAELGARTEAAIEQFERHFSEEAAYAPLIRLLARLDGG